MEHDKQQAAAKKLQTQLEGADLRLEKHVKDFQAYRLDPEDVLDSEDGKLKDPAIVAQDVTEQIVRQHHRTKPTRGLIKREDVLAEAQVPISGAECEG